MAEAYPTSGIRAGIRKFDLNPKRQSAFIKHRSIVTTYLRAGLMRMDKLTSRFQQALSDAQSLAVGRDHNLFLGVRLTGGCFGFCGAAVAAPAAGSSSAGVGARSDS
jgi:hypothetical protein